MGSTTEGSKKRRPRRGSVEGEEAEGADPPKVKQEEKSDAGKQEAPSAVQRRETPGRENGRPQ